MSPSPMDQDRTMRYLTDTLNYTLTEAVNAVNGAAAAEDRMYRLARHQVRWARPGVYFITETPDPRLRDSAGRLLPVSSPGMTREQAAEELRRLGWAEDLLLIMTSLAARDGAFRLDEHTALSCTNGSYQIRERRQAGCCHEPEGREVALAPGYEPGPGEYESWYPHLASGTARTDETPRPDVHDHEEHRDSTGCGGSCSCHGMSMSGICGTCCSGEEPGMRDLAWLLHAIEAVDAHLDANTAPAYRDQPLAGDMSRIGKAQSEAREAMEALAGVTGENPRKGICDTWEHVLEELGDTACAALLGIQHKTKDVNATWAVFLAALAKAYGRVPDARRPS